jgi:hypothetical protein
MPPVLKIFQSLYVRSVSLYQQQPLTRHVEKDGASRIWGHEWLEFEDNCGSQWKQWITRFGPNFKLKGAWGVSISSSNHRRTTTDANFTAP